MKTSVQCLTTSSILSSLAVMVEILGGLLPGIGTLFNGFSTLFIALGGSMGPATCCLTFIATTILLGMFMPASLPFFLFSRGLLGLVLGLSYKYHPLLFLCTGTLSLTLGTCFLGFLLGFNMPILSGLQSSQSPQFGLFPLIIVILYSLLFSWLWLYFFKMVTKRLKPLLGNRLHP